MSKKVDKTMSDILYVTQLSLELHKFDFEKAYTWMITPTNLLFGKKPYEVCITDSKSIIEFLEERLR
jgi:uncharacterized protein (DUF2384 family)